MDEFIKIVTSAFGPFIGHHQGLLAWIKRVYYVLRAGRPLELTYSNYVRTQDVTLKTYRRR